MQNGARWWVGISGFFMVLGGLGPWATGDGHSANGTTGDGWWLIVAGVVGAALAFALRETRSAGAWPLLAGGAGFALTASDISKIEGISDLGVHVRWGLGIALLASVLMGIAGFVGVFQGPEEEVAPPAPPRRQPVYVPPPQSPPPGKTCPDCAEKIQKEARVCRFCGYRFGDAPAADASEAAARALAEKSLKACPDCSKHIDLAASSCPSCGYDFVKGRSAKSAT